MDTATGTDAGTGRRYAGVSRSDRDAERRRRLLEAALDLTGESGVADITVGAVCTRAALAKRYFYESFTSLDDLLSAALKAVFDQIADTIAAAVPGEQDSPRDILTLAVHAVVDAMDDPRAARLYLESAGNAALLATRDDAVNSFVDQLLTLVVGRPVDDDGARMIGHLLVSGSTHVVAMWLRGQLSLTRDEFVEQLVTAGTLAAAGIIAADAPG